MFWLHLDVVLLRYTDTTLMVFWIYDEDLCFICCVDIMLMLHWWYAEMMVMLFSASEQVELYCLHDFPPQMRDQNHSISNIPKEMDIVFAMPVLKDLRSLFTTGVASRMKR